MAAQPGSPVGTRFPTITAPALSGKLITLPDVAAGRVALVAIAFGRQARAMIGSWTGPSGEAFGGDPGFVAYEIPVTDALWARIGGDRVKAGMRAGIPQERHPFVIPFYGNSSGITGPLAITDRSLAWIYLLDPQGIIRWRGQGFATGGGIRELIAWARELRASVQIRAGQ
jgi:hypothetical protein